MKFNLISPSRVDRHGRRWATVVKRHFLINAINGLRGFGGRRGQGGPQIDSQRYAKNPQRCVQSIWPWVHEFTFRLYTQIMIAINPKTVSFFPYYVAAQ